ncbi:MAG: D-alanyl-D-alanine carboxypeptidase family protein [Quinella sp. 1Q5]|nr:D-alanyl-D-alanine carboxypeptidase family protein [Quinella sp. 1Q5]
MIEEKPKVDDKIYPAKFWTAEQLAKVTGGSWIVPPSEDWHVQSFRMGSFFNLRLGQRPTLFLANTDDSLKRFFENVNDFNGAIVSHDVEGLPPNFPLLKVKDVERAMFEIGIVARKRFQGKVIGVTGSCGKTTTCNMLSHVLGKEHNVIATPKNANFYKNVPWIMAHAKQDDDFVVLELAHSALSKVQGSITYDITPDIAVVTSIAPAHLTYKGASSVEGIANYKKRIFCGMSADSYAILNRDMPCYEIFEQEAKSFKLNIITFGTHPEANVRMPELKDGGEFFVAGNAYKLSCPVPAEQLYDALVTVAVSIAVKVPIEKTLDYLKTFSLVKGRGNVLKVNLAGKNLKVIDSTFNANPLSMTYALQHLKSIEPNQAARVAVLGDIAELGKKSVEYHKGLAGAMLDAEPDRLLLCGEFMRYPYEMIKDKLNVTWFKTLEDLIKSFAEYLRDGDTVLIKSSHSTGLSQIVKDVKNFIATPFAPNIPKPLFDVKKFLPEGVTSEMNGRMPLNKLKKIHCGGYLYIDAARAWLAMVRAAAQDNVFLSLNKPFNAYRNINRQLRVFNARYVPVDQDNLVVGAIRVEFEDKLWQLKANENYAVVPGTSSHGYGLAVDIQNNKNPVVKNWLSQNVEQFGFVQEYDFEPWHFTYVKAREGIPARVLEIESLPPEPTYTAEQIEQASGGKWFTPPPKNWTCNGMFYKLPAKAGCLAVVRQDDGLGISEQYAGKINRQLAGFICTNPAPLVEFNRPILVAENIDDAVARLTELFNSIDGQGE